MHTTTQPAHQLVRMEPSVLPEKASAEPRRWWLATYAALLALGAWAGAAGLTAGFLPLPEKLEDRLPFGSPVLGGLALTLLVAVPGSVLTAMAWRGHPCDGPRRVMVGAETVSAPTAPTPPEVTLQNNRRHRRTASRSTAP
jgi:hypothetical protein